MSELHLRQLYTLESRVQFAGWTQADIDSYNGPSPQIVSGLAENVRQKLGSTYCICEVTHPEYAAQVRCMN
jgi:nicotinamide mononucleotide (NMN) deamidase PncC